MDFTPWHAEEANLMLLSGAVGLEITVDETESSVGDFNVDIYATETGTDRKIIIENQLEDTNHNFFEIAVLKIAGDVLSLSEGQTKHLGKDDKCMTNRCRTGTDCSSQELDRGLSDVLSSIVFCGHCGDMYRRTHWNNHGKKQIVWRCVTRLNAPGVECQARTLSEVQLQNLVYEAINKVLGGK